MKELQFNLAHAVVPQDELHILERLTDHERAVMQAVVEAKGYGSDHASLNLVDDKEFLQASRSLAHKFGVVDALFIVGIGGSNLGALAIHEAINGKMHNGIRGPKVFFADTVDSQSMLVNIQMLEAYLAAKRSVVINVISKSGSTTETVANFEILLAVLKKHDPRFAERIVVTTDEGSPFWKLAKQHDFHLLPIPAKVGGRYSVFSCVGLFPLQVLGVDVQSLLAGAADMRDRCLEPHNPALQTACLHYFHSKHKRNIADMFFYATDLESIGKWYRQLLGESIGKEWDLQHTKQVHAGITPTVSIGSTDLHSVGQLYLGGPQDKFTTFITVKKTTLVEVPDMSEYESLVPHIQGKSLHEIMHAIQAGVQHAFKENARPFYVIELPEVSAYALGQLLQFYMMQVMYLGALFGVNPFDQPHVELYKKETKRILSE
jgi:glucose-6-phosphate isomerase